MTGYTSRTAEEWRAQRPAGNGAERVRVGDLRIVVEELLPTVTCSDTNGAGAHGAGGLDLRTVTSLLPTPRASPGEKGGPNQRDSAGHYDLPAIGNLLPTPKAGDGDFGLPRTSGRPPEMSTHLATRLHYTDFGLYASAINRWELVTGRQAPSPTELSPRGKHRLSEHFTEWMMGLPSGWICDTEGITRNDKIKAAGNGVVPQQAAAALADMLTHIKHVELEAVA